MNIDSFIDRQKNKPSICFVAHNAYGVLAQKDTGHAGGVEVQIPLLARWFAKHGYPTSMITWDEGFADRTQIDGVSVFKLCSKDAGLPGLRFLTPRWSSLNSAMKRANADIYYYNCGDLTLGQVGLWTKKHGRKLVFSIANETDCKRSLPALTKKRERFLYKYGLTCVDTFIAQTETQKKLLEEEYGYPSVVIPMPSKGFPVSRATSERTTSQDSQKNILWIGRLVPEKRLEWLLECAEQLPDFQFDVVGAANNQNNYDNELIRRSATLSNVTLHGRVKHDDIGSFLAKTSLLCSTSTYEGFPNVYLEAWSAGVPLVTTFDPDNVISRHGHGKTASSVPELVSAIKHCTDPDQWPSLSEKAKSYFQKYHTVESSLPKYQAVIENII